MSEDPQLRQSWDELVSQVVSDDPVMTALDMGILEGMSPGQVDLFFRTIEYATPTDAELLEQSQRETQERLRQESVRAVQGLSRLGIQSHPWTTGATPQPRPSDLTRVLGFLVVFVLATALLSGLLIGLTFNS